MGLKPEQERVRTLLVDTITLLCRNGLTYKTEFNINALIGITLDKEDIFLVDIRETIKNAAAEKEAAIVAAATAAAAATRSERTESSNSSSSRNKKKRKHSSKGDGGGDVEESDSEVETTSAKTKGANKNKTTDNSTSEPANKRQIKQEMFEQRTAEEEANRNLLIVKPEPGYRQRPCDNPANMQQQFNSNMDNNMPGPSGWDPNQQGNMHPNAQGMHPQNVPQWGPGRPLLQQQSLQLYPSSSQLPSQQHGHHSQHRTHQSEHQRHHREEHGHHQSKRHSNPDPSSSLLTPPLHGDPSLHQSKHHAHPDPAHLSALLAPLHYGVAPPPESLSNLSTNPYRYKCTICGQAFRASTHLRGHMSMKHTGNRDYICRECGKAYAYSWHLKKHMESHTKNLGVSNLDAQSEALRVIEEVAKVEEGLAGNLEEQEGFVVQPSDQTLYLEEIERNDKEESESENR